MNLGNLLILISLVGSILILPTNILVHNKRIRDVILIITAISLTASLILILYYQYTCNFRYSYVVEHISTDLKPLYKISALWAGQSGSFLLWAFISIWLGIAIKDNNKSFNIYMIITIALIAFVYLSDPFAIERVIPSEGNGLNIALQNPWMVIHPPLVFIGYSSMAILFCESFSQSVEKKWTYISLLFLGAGIFTGSIWAYKALGWGGYWAWDPIENAALVPWLILLAIVHKEKVKSYVTMLPFILAVFGTFLARSGILEGKSVHSYNISTMSKPILILISFLCVLLFIIAIKNNQSKDIVKNKGTSKKVLSIFCISTYLFSALILIGTTLPIYSSYNVEVDFYNLLSLAFAIISSILFLIYMKDLFKGNLAIVLIINTILLITISRITKFGEVKWLLILWVLMLPLLLKIIYFNKIKNKSANIAHIGFILMVLGSITSSIFGEIGMFLDTKVTNQEVVEAIIIHNFLEDVIITEGAKYTTKPLIFLFWIGGILIMLSMVRKIWFFKERIK